MICKTIWLLVTVNLIGRSLQHGRMMEPVQRSSMWRKGFNTPSNYNDNELFCGGRDAIQRLGGLCGVCGDPYEADVHENEAGGRYANGIIVRSYPADTSQIRVSIELTAYHKGYYEFRICPHNNFTTRVSQDCLNRNLLPVAEGAIDEGEPTRYYPEKGGTHDLTLFLPPGITCSQCVLQWRYRAGNSWGENGEGRGCIGCGVQEEFRNCADISIGGGTPGSGDGSIPRTPTRPVIGGPIRTPDPAPVPPPITIRNTTPRVVTTTVGRRPIDEVISPRIQPRRPIWMDRGFRDPWGRPLPDVRPRPEIRPTRTEQRFRPGMPSWWMDQSDLMDHRLGSIDNPIIAGLHTSGNWRRPWRPVVRTATTTTTTTTPAPTPAPTPRNGINWNTILGFNLSQLKAFLSRLRVMQSPFRSFSRSNPEASNFGGSGSESLSNGMFLSPDMFGGEPMSFRVRDNTVTVQSMVDETGARVVDLDSPITLSNPREDTPTDVYINKYNRLSKGSLEGATSPKAAWYNDVIARMKKDKNV